MVATDLIKNDLSGALTRGEFELHYQPIVDMSARRVVGFEALLRWVHPEVGHISPADFIPEAEKSGMISSIGAWVIETACQDAACWGRDLRLAINLSPRQLQDDAFLHTIRHALAMSRLPPERLECEITETAITAHSAKALENVHGLKALGIGVSLDDFGTGYSSLGRLSLFPFDTLKVDRSFVAGADRSPKAQAILKHIIGLGRAIGLRTIAEGVETTLQLGAVARDGCREAQGYLFGAPQPIADALAAIPEIERRLSAIVVPPQGPRP